MPYHPIASWGTRRRLEDAGVPARWWTVCAPLLEEVWNGVIGAALAGQPGPTQPTRGNISDDVLANRLVDAGQLLARWAASRGGALPHGALPLTVAKQVVAAARGAQALSTALTVAAAHKVLGRMPGVWSTLNYLREGHTSTVFVARRPDGESVVINIARDATDAAADLTSSVAQQAYWAAVADDVVAAVHQIGEVEIAWLSGAISVPFAAVEHVPAAQELHVVPGTNGGSLVPVAGFEHGPMGPARIRQHQATDPTALWPALVAARSRLAQIRDGSDLGSVAASVTINDGDAVLDAADRGSVRMVACDAQPWTGPHGLLPYRLALVGGIDDGPEALGELWWRDVATSVAVVAETLGRTGLAQQVWPDARRCTPEHVAEALSVPTDLAARAVAAVRELS